MRWLRRLFGDPLREVVEVQRQQLDEQRETIRYQRDRIRDLTRQNMELVDAGVNGRIAAADRYIGRRERPDVDPDSLLPREPPLPGL